MSGMINCEVVNLDQWKRQLGRLSDAAAGQNLIRALKAGALLILNPAKQQAAWRTGTLRRSLHIEAGRCSREDAEVMIGTDVIYGPRVEFGFVGKDKLGRQYNQAARPYLRPAFEQNKDAAIEEVGATLAQLLDRAI